MFIDKLSYPLPATNSAPSSSNWVEPVVQDISMYDGIRSDSNGERHMCAIADGKVYCWGKNSNGQLGVGDNYRRYYPTLVQFPDPSLNFTKILVGRDGVPLARFGSLTFPSSGKLRKAIEKALQN